MPKTIKLGFDSNVENSCYQTASMVALFLFPNPYLQRVLKRRKASLHRLSPEKKRANEFLISTAIELNQQTHQLSTFEFLDLRKHLKQIPEAQDFSTNSPNDIVEWLEQLFEILQFPAFLQFKPNQAYYIVNLFLSVGQSVQSALNIYWQDNRIVLKNRPPLLVLYIQREPVRSSSNSSRGGQLITKNYRISIQPDLQVENQRSFQLCSIITMNRQRNHYCCYVRDPRSDQWFFFSDIGGEFKMIPDFDLTDERPSKHVISVLCNAHVLIYSPQ